MLELHRVTAELFDDKTVIHFYCRGIWQSQLGSLDMWFGILNFGHNVQSLNNFELPKLVRTSWCRIAQKRQLSKSFSLNLRSKLELQRAWIFLPSIQWQSNGFNPLSHFFRSRRTREELRRELRELRDQADFTFFNTKIWKFEYLRHASCTSILMAHSPALIAIKIPEMHDESMMRIIQSSQKFRTFCKHTQAELDLTRLN